jgi:hypothetical protein
MVDGSRARVSLAPSLGPRGRSEGGARPNVPNATCWPAVRFVRAAPRPNWPPGEGLQCYGPLAAAPRTRALTAAPHGVGRAWRWATEFAPAAG